MHEALKALRAVKLWDAWGAALAGCGGDLAAVLAAGAPRVTARRPARRVRVGLSHGGARGQLRLELRVDFTGAPKAEVDVDGAVHREPGVFGDETDEWGAVGFGGKHVEYSVIHQSVPTLMDGVYTRSSFLPRLHRLLDVARVHALETGVDVDLGAAARLHFEPRGKDERAAYAAMGFALTHPDGRPFTAVDEDRWFAARGPNATMPPGVAWRRGDVTILGTTVRFGAAARQMFR